MRHLANSNMEKPKPVDCRGEIIRLNNYNIRLHHHAIANNLLRAGKALLTFSAVS